MSVLLFVFENRPGELSVFIGIKQFLKISSKDVCARGFIDFVVTRSHFPLVSDRNVGSNPLIKPFFLDIGVILLYIVSESIICIGMMTKLCKNAFCFIICCL